MIKAILLAAGQSKRLKSENKLIKLYKKKPLINHSLNALHKSKVNKVIVVLGYQKKELQKLIKKNNKNIFTYNKEYKKGMASSIKVGLRKVNKKDKGKSKKYLIYVLKYRNKVGNPIGFDISTMKKFKRIKGDVGAKFMVKRLKKETKFIRINNLKSFKDFDKVSDFRT